jgi:hypothetical protein
MKHLLTTLAVYVLVIGCGAEEFDNGKQGRGAADLTVALGCGPAAALPEDGTAAETAPALSRAPAEHLPMLMVDGDKSLCDGIRDGGKALTVMVFTDSACADCQAYVDTLSHGFAAEAMAPFVQTYAVVVNNDGSRDSVAGAASGESHDSTWWVGDKDKRLWQFFNPAPEHGAGPVSPLAVVLDGEARGWVVKDGEGVEALWAQMLAAYREVPAAE